MARDTPPARQRHRLALTAGQMSASTACDLTESEVTFCRWIERWTLEGAESAGENRVLVPVFSVQPVGPKTDAA